MCEFFATLECKQYLSADYSSYFNTRKRLRLKSIFLRVSKRIIYRYIRSFIKYDDIYSWATCLLYQRSRQVALLCRLPTSHAEL